MKDISTHKEREKREEEPRSEQGEKDTDRDPRSLKLPWVESTIHKSIKLICKTRNIKNVLPV